MRLSISKAYVNGYFAAVLQFKRLWRFAFYGLAHFARRFYRAVTTHSTYRHAPRNYVRHGSFAGRQT